MACSRFEYVKDFEIPDPILKNCWAVVRIDGRGFTKYVICYIDIIYTICVIILNI